MANEAELVDDELLFIYFVPLVLCMLLSQEVMGMSDEEVDEEAEFERVV